VISLNRRVKKQESGQALVEMALVLPFFLLLLFGLIQMSILGYSYISVNNAARTGVRVASLGGSDDAIITAITNSMIILNNSTLTIQISPSYSQRQSVPGQAVTVNISYPVPLIVPIGGIFPNPVIITANLSMRLE